MAYYKHLRFLTHQKGSEFDELLGPANIAPLSGIYRCEACGSSIVAHNAQPLPGEHHHPHDDGAPIRWRLIVRSHLN